MNDNETKVMTFTGVATTSVPVTTYNVTAENPAPSGNIAALTWAELLNQPVEPSGTGSQIITPKAGRFFFAGMMFDRLRVRSVSVTIRPLILPPSFSTGSPTITLYAAWDRYAGEEGASLPSSTSITSDPSAKAVTWSSGGSGSPLRTWIYSTTRDRYQYMSITHDLTAVTWTPQTAQASVFFSPKLYIVANGQNNVTSPPVEFQLLTRATVEFQGGYSNTTLNYTSVSRSASLEQRVSLLESRYNSNPADNNDDLVSVLNELSNPQ